MDKQEKMRYLMDLPIFSKVKDTELERYASLFIIEKHNKNEYVFEEGIADNYVYFIAEGRVKLLAHSPSGKDVIIKIGSKNDLLTDNDILFSNRKDYRYSAQVLEETVVLKIVVEDFKSILSTHCLVAMNLLQVMDNYLKDSYEVLKEMALEKVERRIALNLIKLARNTGVKNDDGIWLQIKLSRQDIANLSGTTIETAIRVMSKFKKDGLISEDKGHITITDRHQLVSLAEDY